MERAGSVPPPTVPSPRLDDLDLVVRQSIQLVHELLDLALSHGALRGRLGGVEVLVERHCGAPASGRRARPSGRGG